MTTLTRQRTQKRSLRPEASSPTGGKFGNDNIENSQKYNDLDVKKSLNKNGSAQGYGRQPTAGARGKRSPVGTAQDTMGKSFV